MAKLVAFYSRAGENYFGGQYRKIEVGNTEKAAKMIAEATGAELFKIEQKVPYSDDYKECVAEAAKDFKENARPELAVMPENLNDYDEIYIMETRPLSKRKSWIVINKEKAGEK